VLTLAEVLAELPDTADGIAERMRALGIKGQVQDDFCCPIANFLTSRGFEDAMVGEEWIEVCEDSGSEQGDTPPAVAEFVRRFDTLAWPDLVQVAS
jgi:hypothetical protein